MVFPKLHVCGLIGEALNGEIHENMHVFVLSFIKVT